MRRHDGRGNAQLTLDVQTEAVGRLLVAECADADPVPGPLGAEVCLRHVWLETGPARASLQADSGVAILRGSDLDGEIAWFAGRRRQRRHGSDRRGLEEPPAS